MNKGKRYSGEERLNYKKVVAALIAIFVIFMFILIVKDLIKEAKDSKNTTVIDYYALYANDKWGIVGTNGETVIEPMYKEMPIVINKSRDIFLLIYDIDEATEEYKTKVVDKENKQIFTEYTLVEALENYDSNSNVWYEEDILRVKKDGKYGIIDLDGKEIIPIVYDSIKTLKGTKNSLLVEKDGKYGLVNKSGTTVIKTDCKSIENIDEDYKHGYIVTASDNKKGIVGYTGTQILEAKYDKIIKSYNEKYFAVEENGKKELVDIEGKVVLSSGYDEIIQVNSDGIVFIKNKKFGFMDLEGKEKIKPEYDEIKELKLGVLKAKKDNKCGLIDIDGKELLKPEYTNIYYEEKVGLYIAEDESFNSIIVDSEFNIKLKGIISEFNIDSGYMKVKTGTEEKYYNFKFEVKDIKDVLSTNTLFVSKKDGKYGFVDKDGKVVVDYIYEEALEQNKYGFAAVKKNGLWGSIDKDGKVVQEPKYKLTNNLIVDFLGKWHLGQELNMNYYCEK